MPLRQFLGALAYDSVRFERHVRGRWDLIRNRHETITINDSGPGARCEWRWTSPVDYCRFVPGADVRLLRAALAQWPIRLASALDHAQAPQVTFLIGHRGLARLPLLLLTLRSIAAQRDAAIECIVIEQDVRNQIESALPSWVRYIHQPVGESDPYNRAMTFNTGAAAARGRTIVLHDNDMLVPERYAAEVAAHVENGWEAVDLKRFIFYLTPVDTTRVIAAQRLALDEHSEVVIQNLHGGSVAIRREAYDAIGGLDEKFVGWGGEDVDFWERAETLRATRFGYLPIVHLWHAPQSEKVQGDAAPAVRRYYELAELPPQERIARLRSQRR
ncbi:MAG: hypothetical protein QOK37_2026 [Thermoanaerobaculia bacterium]|jgi:hypothetical protein|nr:hypothetical protein [Thermoanaerobaculia bacterium]